MPGVKQFDCATILDRAARVFWDKGYEATSIQDLEAATGLGRGSLYNAFGDKEALFIAVLERYGETLGAAPLRHLGCPDARAGVAAMLGSIVARMDDPADPRGCLLTNSCTRGGTPAIDAAAASAMRALQDAILGAIRRAHTQGQLAADADPRALARFYTAIVQSLGVMHKTGPDTAALRDIVTIAMRAWPGPDPASKR